MEFRLIAFTPERILPGEADAISLLLDGGVNYLHLRHPYATAEELKGIITSVPQRFHPYIRLHDHFELLSEFRLAGVQLGRRNPEAPENATTITRSCHSLIELDDIGRYEYVTLSPVYPSISKKGYVPSENFLKVKNVITGKPVIALGGVRVRNLTELMDAGFSGAAMLGEIWGNDSDLNGIKRFLKRIKQII